MMSLSHATMIPLMAVAMILRFREYARHSHSHSHSHEHRARRRGVSKWRNHHIRALRGK